MKETIADQDRVTCSYARYAAIPVRDEIGFTRPHTYGVRHWSCSAIATKPPRPTACMREHQSVTNGAVDPSTIVHCTLHSGLYETNSRKRSGFRI